MSCAALTELAGLCAEVERVVNGCGRGRVRVVANGELCRFGEDALVYLSCLATWPWGRCRWMVSYKWA